MLIEQNAAFHDQVANLIEQVAALSKNSSNSSKPPSFDIVKPPKPNNTGGPRRQGGQPGHKGGTRPPFRADQTCLPAGRSLGFGTEGLIPGIAY